MYALLRRNIIRWTRGIRKHAVCPACNYISLPVGRDAPHNELAVRWAPGWSGEERVKLNRYRDQAPLHTDADDGPWRTRSRGEERKRESGGRRKTERHKEIVNINRFDRMHNAGHVARSKSNASIYKCSHFRARRIVGMVVGWSNEMQNGWRNF